MSDPIPLRAMNPAGAVRTDRPRLHSPRPGPQGASFAELLRSVPPGPQKATLSAHASQRLKDRGIELDAERWTQVDQAIDALVQKGGREGLVLGEEVSFVVNLSNRTVITALSEQEAREHVFTNIDSAAILPRREAGSETSNTSGPAPNSGSPDAAERQTRRPILEV